MCDKYRKAVWIRSVGSVAGSVCTSRHYLQWPASVDVERVSANL